MKACTHGHARRGQHSRAYDAWREMLKRCRSPRYKYHHGRGIKVCARWRQFENFLADMGDCPPGLTLDRKDSNDNYTPKGNDGFPTHVVLAAFHDPAFR